jgi:hypothetical protein
VSERASERSDLGIRTPAQRAGALATLWSAFALAACATAEPAAGPTPIPAGFSWALPAEDTASDGVDGEIYQALRRSCDEGDTMLAAEWQHSSSPRNVLLFAAGAQACRGATAQARTLYQRAKDEYGWSGLGPAQSNARCDVYKSVASVVENAPRDRFPCPDGASPTFTQSPDGVMDNPLTAVDESAVTAVPTAAPIARTNTALRPRSVPSGSTATRSSGTITGPGRSNSPVGGGVKPVDHTEPGGTTKSGGGSGGSTRGKTTTAPVRDHSPPTGNPPVANPNPPVANPNPPVANPNPPVANPIPPMGNTNPPMNDPTPVMS